MSQSEPLVGYVTKMYPRFSETFVVNEIRAREAQGERIEIFSLRPPIDGRFHGTLAEVRAPVTYLSHSSMRASQLWDVARVAQAAHPAVGRHLEALFGLEALEAAEALELATYVEQRGIDHLHAHFGSTATSVARVAARISGRPYSFTAHAKDIFHTEVDHRDLERKLAEAHHVVTVSDYNLQHLRHAFPAASRAVHRVYNGVDLDRFGLEAGPRRNEVVAVGRLVEKKGFDVLVDAVALLAAQGHQVPCLVAGDGPLAEDLAARARGAGVQHLVRFLGPLPENEIRALVAGAAVLAAPCVVGADGNADGLPTVLLEALALGTPCVSTYVTGIPEVVRHESTGLLVPPGDASALAAALERLLGDEALQGRVARQGRALVEAEFDLRRQARVLRSLLDSGGLARRDEVA
jgi:colanic acid/amylovoran biosynthesis glycosyltransferase